MAAGEAFDRLDVATGTRVLEHARAIVEATVHDETPPDPPDVSVFDQYRGVFVTLEDGANLRGCIGRPMPEQPLRAGLRAAARGAATSDPRFPPLTPDELPSVTVETSILTPPRVVDGNNPDAIVVGRDGLIVSNGRHRGLLLPQVASERDWDGQRFLKATARKAGLRPDACQHPGTTVERFSAQVFAEQSPGGPVTVEDYTRPGGVATAQSTD